jgi:hypothetical protein
MSSEAKSPDARSVSVHNVEESFLDKLSALFLPNLSIEVMLKFLSLVYFLLLLFLFRALFLYFGVTFFYFLIQQLKSIFEVVQVKSLGKPVEIMDWCEDVVVAVFRSLYLSSQNRDSGIIGANKSPADQINGSEELLCSPSLKLSSDGINLSSPVGLGIFGLLF